MRTRLYVIRQAGQVQDLKTGIPGTEFKGKADVVPDSKARRFRYGIYRQGRSGTGFNGRTGQLHNSKTGRSGTGFKDRHVRYRI